jgi:hypothetical protein
LKSCITVPTENRNPNQAAEQYPIDFKKSSNMKNLRLMLACVCIAFSGITAFAQEARSPLNEPDLKKPLLFAGMPDRIPVSTDYINSLFGSPTGRTVSFTATTDKGSAAIEGLVVSTGSEEHDALQSVVIRSTNFNGARFTVSRYVDPQGNVSYSGRIISFKHGDAYELKNESGNLVLVKRKFYSLVNE